MAPPKIVLAALDLGWQTNAKHPSVVVRNTLTEMVAKGEVIKGDDGKYALPRQLLEISPGLNGVGTAYAEKGG